MGELSPNKHSPWLLNGFEEPWSVQGWVPATEVLMIWWVDRGHAAENILWRM